MNELLLVVADIKLAVDVALGTVVVNLNCESLGAVTGEGIKNGLSGNVDATEVGAFFPDNFQPCAEGTAVGVGLSSDGEVEFPAGIILGNLGSGIKAEVNNIDLAAEIVGHEITGS